MRSKSTPRGPGLAVGLTYDLRDDYRAEGFLEEEVAEFDSEETIRSLAETIESLGHRVDRIGNAKALCRRLVGGDRWELVFNIAEGVRGRSREAQVPCLLELYDIPYTFSDPLVSAITLDKEVAKRLVRQAGLNTPESAVVSTAEDLPRVRLRYPLFAKPLAEGTGKGIDARSRVETPEGLEEVCRDLLARVRQPVLVEEYLPGREFTVGVLGTGEEARAIGTMEVGVLDGVESAVYGYVTKEECETLVRYSPVADPGLRAEAEDLSLRVHRALECRDASRVDIRLDRGGRPSFMEINPLPGLHPTHSDLPMVAAQEGMAYAELIGSIIESAKTRIGKVHGW
ncbi:MAG: D-alanine--D-alanine ligase [Candidatus Eisenbacteria bacterium]